MKPWARWLISSLLGVYVLAISACSRPEATPPSPEESKKMMENYEKKKR